MSASSRNRRSNGRRAGICHRLLSKSIRSTFAAKVGRHSEKPEEFHWIVEQLCGGPYVELFARRQRQVGRASETRSQERLAVNAFRTTAHQPAVTARTMRSPLDQPRPPLPSWCP